MADFSNCSSITGLPKNKTETYAEMKYLPQDILDQDTWKKVAGNDSKFGAFTHTQQPIGDSIGIEDGCIVIKEEGLYQLNYAVGAAVESGPTVAVKYGVSIDGEVVAQRIGIAMTKQSPPWSSGNSGSFLLMLLVDEKVSLFVNNLSNDKSLLIGDACLSVVRIA